MSVDPSLRLELRRFERRAVRVAFGRSVALSLLLVVLSAELAMLFGLELASFRVGLTAMAVAAVAASAVHAVRQRPGLLALARRIDARAHLDDLVVSAIQFDDGGMSSLVRRASVAVLRKTPPATVYPLEPPRHWRRWLAAAAAAQVIVLPLVLREPAARATQSGASTLVMPAAGGAGSAPRNDRQTQTASPQTSVSAQSVASSAISPASVMPARDRANAAAADAAAAIVAGDGDRLRLAAANAADDISAGRVPIARRRFVERYFAALQTQRQRPR